MASIILREQFARPGRQTEAPLQVFVVAPAFAHEHQLSMRIARAENYFVAMAGEACSGCTRRDRSRSLQSVAGHTLGSLKQRRRMRHPFRTSDPAGNAGHPPRRSQRQHRQSLLLPLLQSASPAVSCCIGRFAQHLGCAKRRALHRHAVTVKGDEINGTFWIAATYRRPARHFCINSGVRYRQPPMKRNFFWLGAFLTIVLSMFAEQPSPIDTRGKF